MVKKTLFSKTVKGVNAAALSALRQCFLASGLWERLKERVDSKEKRESSSRRRQRLWWGVQPAAGAGYSSCWRAASSLFLRVQLCLCAFIRFIPCSAFEQLPSHPDSADKLWLLRPTNCPSDFLVCKGTAGQWSTGLIRAEHRNPCSTVLRSKPSWCDCLTQYRSFSYVFQQSPCFPVLLLLEIGGHSMGFVHLQFCWFVTFL